MMAALNPATHDYIAESLNDPVAVELVQSALLRLTAHRGAFWFDPTLGSRLHLLAREKDLPRVKKLAFEYATEALATLKNDYRATAIDINVTQTEVGRLDLAIVLTTPDGQAVQINYFVQVGG